MHQKQPAGIGSHVKIKQRTFKTPLASSFRRARAQQILTAGCVCLTCEKCSVRCECVRGLLTVPPAVRVRVPLPPSPAVRVHAQPRAHAQHAHAP